MQSSSLPKIALTIAVWVYTVDMQAASEEYDFSLNGWVARVFMRDLFLMVAIAGVWDWLLYFSPLKDRMTPYKFNKRYPKWSQFQHDIFWTTSATLLGSVQEVVLMRWWASGSFIKAPFGVAPAGETRVPYDTPFFGTKDTVNVLTIPIPLSSQLASVLNLTFLPNSLLQDGNLLFHAYTGGFILWTMSMLYWRIVHFHVIHRGMHPWFKKPTGSSLSEFKKTWKCKLDPGAFLYRVAHSHHHKSYNPTAFSGFSMVPIESVAYISAALIPLFFRHGCHPWIHLYTKMDLIIGAQIGHDGFDAPGGGSYFHQLHHAHFECNYGDAAFPLDWIFGTFENGSSYNKQKKVNELKTSMNSNSKQE